MATRYTPRIVTDGLVLCLDAGNTKSYPGSGTTWTDLSRNGNNGTLTNGPTLDSANGGSIVFDGTNDYVTIPDAPNLRVGTGITVSAWIICYSAITGPPITFVSKGYSSSTNNAFSLFGYQGKLQWNIGSFVSFGRAWTPPATWSYITGIYDTTNMYIYLNGQLYTSDTHTGGAPLSDATAVTIGCETESGGLTFFANMKCAAVTIYNRALASSEVLQNYNATKSRFNL